MSDKASQHADRKRDARLRNALLEVLHRNLSNHHGGWVTLDFLHDTAAGFKTGDQGFLGRVHCVNLLRDLVALGYVAEEDNREDRDQFYLDHCTFRITGDGVRFLGRDLPATAMIDDGRIVK